MDKNLTKPIFVVRGWYNLAKSLAIAMFYWAKSGFKIVPYYLCWKRRLICKNCTSGVGSRCPTCGCFIWAITKLSSSRCSNWDKYLGTDKETIIFEEYEPTEH